MVGMCQRSPETFWGSRWVGSSTCELEAQGRGCGCSGRRAKKGKRAREAEGGRGSGGLDVVIRHSAVVLRP